MKGPLEVPISLCWLQAKPGWLSYMGHVSVNAWWERCHFRDLILWLRGIENLFFWKQEFSAMGYECVPSKLTTDQLLKVNSSPSVTFLCLNPALLISNLSSLWRQQRDYSRRWTMWAISCIFPVGGIFIAKQLTLSACHDVFRCFCLASGSEYVCVQKFLPNYRCEEVLKKSMFCEWKKLYFVGMSDSVYRLLAGFSGTAFYAK